MKLRTANASARRAFTLLEMVFVLGIIGILLAVTLPAFLKLTHSNAVDTAASMIASQLRLARAEAVARRQYIAVIMPGREFRPESDSEPPADVPIYRYQSFRAAIVTKDGEDYVFSEWYPGTQWTFLPLGAIIAEADGDNEISADDDWIIGNDNDNSTLVTIAGSESEEEAGGESGEDQTLRAVIFKPDGRCVGKTFVTVLEGVNTIPDSELPVAAPDADEFIFQGVNKHNLRVLEVSPTTGKVRVLN
ncbi:MAG: prepilin-type N-terminal cleavage/methylation domain-containing protein [Lentisphaerae bacterium]|jgi:prepilin-type N-terminal cleavage/methylation domain-containing protein|nr:prepilin-type N-terminal cleavage/methylation domain-containing protein [Lentisphaerota bacterium]